MSLLPTPAVPTNTRTDDEDDDPDFNSYNPNTCETLSAWIKKNPPSKRSTAQLGPWLYVGHKSDEDLAKHEDIMECVEECKKEVLDPIHDKIQSNPKVMIRAAEKEKAIAKIISIAKEANCLVGKWMLFIPSDKIDYIWSTVAHATLNGELGCSSKCSTHNEEPKHLICCYVNDLTNELELRRVLKTMMIDLNLGVTSGFKPDIFTYLGIYSNNPWRLPVTIHTDILKEVKREIRDLEEDALHNKREKTS